MKDDSSHWTSGGIIAGIMDATRIAESVANAGCRLSRRGQPQRSSGPFVSCILPKTSFRAAEDDHLKAVPIGHSVVEIWSLAWQNDRGMALSTRESFASRNSSFTSDSAITHRTIIVPMAGIRSLGKVMHMGLPTIQCQRTVGFSRTLKGGRCNAPTYQGGIRGR
jgi:hypothetical protein